MADQTDADKAAADKAAAEAAAKSTKLVKARVLVASNIDGVTFGPDDVIEADSKTIKLLEKNGQADSSDAAVAYAESLKA